MRARARAALGSLRARQRRPAAQWRHGVSGDCAACRRWHDAELVQSRAAKSKPHLVQAGRLLCDARLRPARSFFRADAAMRRIPLTVLPCSSSLSSVFCRWTRPAPTRLRTLMRRSRSATTSKATARRSVPLLSTDASHESSRQSSPRRCASSCGNLQKRHTTSCAPCSHIRLSPSRDF